MAVEFCAC